MACSCQALLPMDFSRQEYWSELPCPPPGELPNPEIEPRSLALPEDYHWATREAHRYLGHIKKTALGNSESPLDCKEIQPVHPEGDQSWVFIGRNNAEAETPVLWPPHVKSWLIGKDPDVGRDWGQKGKGTTEDEMAGWHHRLYGHEFESTLGVGNGQGGLACCDSWGCKELDTTDLMNSTELTWMYSEIT